MPEQNGTESAADIQRQWGEISSGSGPGGFIPPDEFAKLPKAVRNRLTEAAKATTKVDKLEQSLQGLTQQMQAFMAAAGKPQQQPVNLEGNGRSQNGNGNKPAPKSLAELQQTRRRLRAAERSFLANPDDANAKSIVMHPDFDTMLENVEVDIAKAIAAEQAGEAVRPITEKIEHSERFGAAASASSSRLADMYGRSVVGNPENDLNKKAAEIRAQLLAERGVDPNNPAHSDRLIDLNELAWARAQSEMSRAGRENATRRPLEMPGSSRSTDAGAPQMDERMAEVSALIAQGERGKAHDLAMAVFNETRMLHPAFNAQDRTAR